jgi:hypothetical protein
MLAQPEAAPSHNSLARTRKKEEEEDGHKKFSRPAHERRRGRTNAPIFVALQCLHLDYSGAGMEYRGWAFIAALARPNEATAAH